MTKEELQMMMDQLVQGQVDDIKIEKNDFMIFREIWINHEKKDQIIGEALHNGVIIYRYRSN
ncbi:hypothetical protein LHA31_03115 [Carnobacterium viridans]|uniref:Uncharacterized protein n=1 Tax=Carnobacterium viridans TaxID=174587 RepID=A0A1H1BI08_9LACT|nr:hypothetical protein [Carnobacterium viridans]UDE95778.1 hypothetical protein LHA31_03115 [Carnobacterium viridans]SDQ51547.1 hypothetical protein SAMN04487752_2596 [Carnobacterium viridans]